MTARETHGFQAEVKQLLQLMIHSLYSNREIFLRELISNASDAADKLRFEAIAHPGYLAEDSELRIRIEADPAAGTLSVIDNGIGMSREDIIAQLGTIARSGTAEFISRLGGKDGNELNLIGQFGVGFYSAFTVADRVEVQSRRAGLPADAGVRWESAGDGEFSIEAVEDAPRGTRVTLHLREDAREFADGFRLRALIRKYSDHIAFPVLMKKAEPAEGEPAEEAVNAAKALWTRPKSDIGKEEYEEFYRHIAHDFAAPLAWSHNRVEGKRVYTSLLYIPAQAPFDLWNREKPRGLKLYVRRVFILDDAAQFLPAYLRFMRGVIDADGLSLNVSREMLQQDPEVDAIRGGLTRRVLDMLDKLAEEPEKYRGFWQQFGRVLKEGPAEDFANRERIARLLRFTSTRSTGDEADRSLADYIAGKAAGQGHIWYITADSLAAARSSPQLEIFGKHGVEVLLLGDPIDEWMVGQLGEFEGLGFRDARRGVLDPAEIGGSEADAPPAVDADGHEALLGRLKQALGSAVGEVRVTGRLTDSPACLAIGEDDMGPQMRRVLAATGQSLPDAQPILEINPAHPLVQRLEAEQDGERFADVAHVLFDQARLAEGGALADPGAFVKRLNRLLVS